MKVAFNDGAFAFEFVRNLGFAYYGGADIGDMMATVPEIIEGDFESWFTAWNKRGKRLLDRAEEYQRSGHLVSAREAFLRASTYLRMAEFYLHGNPDDLRILTGSRASQQAYAEAAKLFGTTWERVEIPYEGTTLPGYFYKVDDSGRRRPTVVFHGGFDSSAEELYYYGAAAAVRRGYNCLTFDGPGQGRPIREQSLPFRYDWEKVVTPVVDYAVERTDVDPTRLALIGMSLGGYLAARAVAFEHRFKAAIFFDGVYDFYESLQNTFPEDALQAYEAGDGKRCEEVIRTAMKSNTALRWAVEQAMWSLGAASLSAFFDSTKDYTMKGLAERIQCPCLVMEAEKDIFFQGQPQRIYEKLQAPKLLAKFSSEDGAENHCQSGAMAYKDEVVFNWLDQQILS